ncbi:hypothetical protein [Luteibacter sp.]|jgi:hypothetical protein|uniref:hypothetical protein n=1 Tax=Luteibacter sp. TaxID=1886636 RepID=UPI002F417183
MKPHLRLAVFASLLPLSSLAADTPPFDAYKALVQFRVQNHGAASAFDATTNPLLSQLQVDTASPYSDLIDQPVMANETWWPVFLESVPSGVVAPGDTIVGMLQWQLGLTKARPNVDVTVSDEDTARYRGHEAAANALKAEVDADIFWKARDLNGSHFAEAAGEAVALQILRDQIARNDAEDYESLAIKPDVLRRYMEQTNPERVDDSGREYLGTILRHAITSRPSFEDGGSRRGLPTIYRVARTAAAYADADGYTRPGGYCSGNQPRPSAPDTWPIQSGSPLCFVAAHDRAVTAWYRWELRDEAVRRPPPPEQSGLSKLMHWVGVALLLIDGAAFMETIDAAVADDLAFEGALSDEEAELASRRASRLTCGIHR